MTGATILLGVIRLPPTVCTVKTPMMWVIGRGRISLGDQYIDRRADFGNPPMVQYKLATFILGRRESDYNSAAPSLT
jgi:hypothetical protein